MIPRLLDITAAAEYLSIGVSTFRDSVPIEPTRIGRRVLYDRVKIDRWLDGGNVSDADSALEVFLDGQDADSRD